MPELRRRSTPTRHIEPVVTRSVATLETSAVLSKAGFAIAAIGFLLLTRWKVPPLAVVVLCTLAGIGEATWH
jgi:hypothetical protein